MPYQSLWTSTYGDVFLTALKQGGADPERVFASVGLRLADYASKDATMPLSKHVALRESAAAATGDDFFGLHLGLSLTPRDGGALGYVFMHSPTVGEAVRNVARYMAVMNQGCEVALRTEEAHGTWTYQLKDMQIRERRQDSECTLAMGLLLIRAIADDDWSPLEAHFEHAAPRNVAELERVFGGDLHFQQSMNALVMRRDLLDRIVRGADSRLFPILEDHIRNMLGQLPPADDFMLQVRHELAKSLATGNAHVEYLAKQLGLGARTLQRRLHEHDASYRSVLEGVRRELALRYLAERGVSVTEVAFLLGYHDTSAFIRAFRRWTGVSPLAHRRRILDSGTESGSPLRSA